MPTNLYEKCSHCDGQREEPGDGFGEILTCALCAGDGFTPTGVTLEQVDRWGSWERFLNGDPGLPEADRAAAESYILGRLVARGYALAR